MLFGYLVAAIAGFLLTAVPNWTGRLPVLAGRWRSLGLVLALGRARLAWLGGPALGVRSSLDLAFPATLAAVAAREIVAGGTGATCRSSAGRPARPWPTCCRTWRAWGSPCPGCWAERLAIAAGACSSR